MEKNRRLGGGKEERGIPMEWRAALLGITAARECCEISWIRIGQIGLGVVSFFENAKSRAECWEFLIGF